jgi:Aspartyl protease/PDZ domain
MSGKNARKGDRTMGLRKKLLASQMLLNRASAKIVAGTVMCVMGCGVAASEQVDLLEKHIKAVGGEQAIRNVKTAHFLWNVSISIIQGTVEEWIAAPGKHRIEIKTPVISQTEGENESISWSVDQNGQVTTTDLEDPIPSEMVLPVYQYMFPGENETVSDAGEIERDGSKYRVLEIHRKDKPLERLYLDSETFLAAYEEGEENGIPVTTIFDDYRLVDGVMIAHTYSQQADIQGMPPSVFSLKTVSLNEELDVTCFNPPVERKKDYTFLDGKTSIEVPIDIEGEHLFVDVSINRGEISRFLLDSGAGTTIVGEDLVKRLNLKTKEGMQALGVGGVESIGATSVDSLDIGGFRIQDLRLFSADLDFLKNTFSEPVDGVLGYDLFIRSVLRLDYMNKRLTILDPETYSYTGEGEIIKGQIKSNLIHINGMLNGEFEGEFRVDTGAGGGVHLHAPFVQKHDLLTRCQPQIEISATGVAGNQTSILSRGTSLELGSLTVSAPLLTLTSDVESGALAMMDSIGTIGNAVWRKFTIIFDYTRNRMILEPNRLFPLPMTFNRSGCFLTQKDDAIIVHTVLSGTPADDAGLKAGDRLLKINKVSVDQVTLNQVKAMLNGPDGQALKVKVERNGRRMWRQLILRDYV